MVQVFPQKPLREPTPESACSGLCSSVVSALTISNAHGGGNLFSRSAAQKLQNLCLFGERRATLGVPAEKGVQAVLGNKLRISPTESSPQSRLSGILKGTLKKPGGW